MAGNSNPFDTTPTLPLPTRRWLMPDEAAAYLGISRSQFDAIVSVPPSRTAGKQRPRYDVQDLDTMMMKGKDGISNHPQR